MSLFGLACLRFLIALDAWWLAKLVSFVVAS